MTARALVDGHATGMVPLDDRGLRYGDGLFETIRIDAGRPVWWEAHLERLARGCAVLGLDMPPPVLLADELAQLCGSDHGVLRLLLTRGGAARGYAPATAAPVRRILVLSAAPPVAAAPLVLGWATLRLGIQPRLAGLKHLNRLEQVLAARECAALGTDECLLLDAEGAVTCGVAGNLFIVGNGRLRTPLLDRCGVAGTCREWILRTHAGAREERLDSTAVDAADELFLCNSVRGILPVGQLGARRLPVGALTRALMQRLADEQPALRHPLLAAAGRAAG